MKNKNFLLGILAIMLLFGIIFNSCETEEPTYTVWTDSTSYSQFYNSFGTLNDGYYIRYEFTFSQWDTISSSLTNEGKHNWTENEIKSWFIGRGFGESEANREKAWLMTIDHGFIASRSGSIVYMLLK